MRVCRKSGETKMAGNMVEGVFASLRAAEHARSSLLDNGIAEARISLSGELTADDVAAEAPGQTYSNQPGHPAGAGLAHGHADAAHAGACVLCVDVDAGGDRNSVERIMRDCGAQQTLLRH